MSPELLDDVLHQPNSADPNGTPSVELVSRWRESHTHEEVPVPSVMVSR